MAVVTGKQLKQILQNNQPIQSGTTSVQSGGFLDDIISGLLDPLKSASAKYTEQGRMSMLGDQYAPKFISAEQAQALKDNPNLEQAKSVIGLASYAMPGGGGSLLGAAGRGALAGGSYGFGMSKPGQEIQDTLTGAAGGAAGGAAFYGAGKLANKAISKLKGTGNVTKETGVIGIIDDAIEKKRNDLLAQGKTIQEVNTRLGTKVSNQRFNYISENLQGDDLKQALSELTRKVDKSDPIYSAIEKLSNNELEKLNNPASVVTSTQPKVIAPDVAKIESQLGALDDQYKSVLGKLNKVDEVGGLHGNKVNNVTKLQSQLDEIASQRNVLRDQLKGTVESASPVSGTVTTATKPKLNTTLSTFDPELTAQQNLENFGKVVTGADKSKNWLQKQGLKNEVKQIGVTAKPTVGFTKQFDETANMIDQAYKFTGKPRNARGIDEIGLQLKELVDQAADEATKAKKTTNFNTLLTESRIKELARRTKVSFGEAEQAIRDQLSYAGNLPQVDLNDYMQGNIKVNPNQVLQIKRATYNVANKVFEKGTDDVDNMAQKFINDWAKQEMERLVPGSRNANMFIAKLGDQTPGIVQAFNTGLGGNYVASPQSLPTAVLKTVMGRSGKIMRNVGDIVAKEKNIDIPIPSALGNILEKTNKTMSSPLVQGSLNFLDNRIAPIMMNAGGSVIGAPSNQQLPVNNFTQTKQMNPNVLMSSLGSQPTGPSGIGGGILNNPNAKQILTMGIVSGAIDAQQGKLLMDLVDSQNPMGNLTAGQQDKLQGLQTSISNLDNLETLISKNKNEFGPTNIGGRLGDSLGGVFASPNREYIRSQMDFLTSQLLKELSGTGASDREYNRVRGMLPQLEDTTDVALQKLSAVRDLLNNRLQNTVTPLTALGMAQ